MITPNETEAEMISGVKITDDATLYQAAQALLDQGVQRVFLSLGGDGVFAAQQGETHLEPICKAEMRNATGAGDAMMASLVWSFLAGRDLAESCAAGTAAAAIAVESEETINPNKTLPRGILLSLAVSTVLYIVMTMIMTGVVPYKEFAKYIDAPVAGVILETGMNWLAVIVNLGALIGMTTVMLVQLYGQSRICYAMSRDGLFPKFFGHVHEKYRTPFKGTWFFGLLTAFAGGFININVLFELVNIGTLSAFIIVSAGILWMRKTQPNAPRGFRAPGVPVTPILAIVFCFVLIAGLNWETWVRFAVWFGLGLIVYFGYSRKRSKLGLEQKAGADAKVAATED